MSAPAARVLHVLGHVQRHLDGDVSLGALARVARRDRFELHRAFRRVAGETTKQYTSRLRLDRAAAELLAGNRTILEVALASGFASHEVFTRAFRRRFGVSPRLYRRRGLVGPESSAVRHAAVVRNAAPCIGLYRMSSQEMRRTAMSETESVTVTVNRRELTGQPALAIRRQIKQAEIPVTLAEILPRVFQHAQQAGIPLAGPPFVRYLSVGRGLMTIEGGMPVAAAGGGEGEIEAIELPAGPAAVAVHVGAYERLEDTYAAIEAWIASSGHRSGGAPWEVYVTDPADHPDPAEWRTEVIWPLDL
jgi:AraC family transcriptional regulator